MGNWQKGDPPKHGYYLAAWRRGNGVTVSELWFNPDAVKHWWFSRAYTGEKHHGNPMNRAVPGEVVAWMPLPLPPEEPTTLRYAHALA